jgi:hypothetical protein
VGRKTRRAGWPILVHADHLPAGYAHAAQWCVLWVNDFNFARRTKENSSSVVEFDHILWLFGQFL